MSAGRVILGGTILGAAYLVYANRDQAPADLEPVYAPAPQNAPQQQSKLAQFAPLLDWGIGNLMNRNRSTQTGTATRPNLGGIFEQFFGGGATATATQGGGNAGGLLDLIGRLEAPQGYAQVYGGTRLDPPRPITTMTVGEVLDWQSRSVAAGSASSAAGRYQIIRPTLSGLVSQGAVSRSDRFDQATQDRLAGVLMERRGLSSYRSGRMSAETFANNLAKEWASLPVVTGGKRGRSYYAGDGLNNALTTPDTVLKTIKAGV